MKLTLKIKLNFFIFFLSCKRICITQGLEGRNMQEDAILIKDSGNQNQTKLRIKTTQINQPQFKNKAK